MAPFSYNRLLTVAAFVKIISRLIKSTPSSYTEVLGEKKYSAAII